jgi:hypothetical protein
VEWLSSAGEWRSADRIIDEMIRLAILITGILVMAAAGIIAVRRSGQHRTYGGRAAFSYHVFVVAGFGCALVLGAAFSAPTELLGYVLVILGCSDVLLGYLARRRRSGRD